MTYEINGLGSGWAHAGQLSALELLALKAESLVSGPKAEIAATPPCWGIDGSYYCKNAVQVVNDAIAAGASFVIWKASDAVQLKAGSSSDVGNYIDPTFYDVVQACYEKVPVFGYHFLHLDNAYFGAPDPNSPSADFQWRTMRNWLGLPVNQPHSPRAIQAACTDFESYKLDDGVTWNFQEDGPVVLQQRLKLWDEWMKHMVDPALDPYLTQMLLYTSPGFVKSYCPTVVVDIDNNPNFQMWLATWFFVKHAIANFSKIPALLPTTGWPLLGQYTEKVKIWQCGTVAYAGTEVDINIFRGTQADLFKWLNFTSAVVPPVVFRQRGSRS